MKDISYLIEGVLLCPLLLLICYTSFSVASHMGSEDDILMLYFVEKVMVSGCFGIGLAINWEVLHMENELKRMKIYRGN